MPRRSLHLLLPVLQFDLAPGAPTAHHPEHADTQAHQKPETATAPRHRHASDFVALCFPFSFLASGRLPNDERQAPFQLPDQKDAVDQEATFA